MIRHRLLTRRLWLLLPVLGSVFLCACTATRAPIDDSDLRLQAASHAFGGHYDYLIVTASGRWKDQAALGVGRILGPNQLSRDLATRLLKAAKSPVRILVSGHNRQKTLRVIQDAFSFVRRQRLAQLEFLFLGHADDAEAVRRMVGQVGGRYRFKAF